MSFLYLLDKSDRLEHGRPKRNSKQNLQIILYFVYANVLLDALMKMPTFAFFKIFSFCSYYQFIFSIFSFDHNEDVGDHKNFTSIILFLKNLRNIYQIFKFNIRQLLVIKLYYYYYYHYHSLCLLAS